jgi:glycosyltransferase involved in cell wall biosynthesis
MLAGVPVVATDAGAASDILEGGTAGTLVRPDDADDLAAAIKHVLADPAALQAQLDHAAARARTHYGVPQMLDTVSDVIQRVAAKSGT